MGPNNQQQKKIFFTLICPLNYIRLFLFRNYGR